VNVPLQDQHPQELTAALVTSIPGLSLDDGLRNAVIKAGKLLRAAGWHVEEATPPEIPKVGEVFAALLAPELEAMVRRAQPILSDELILHVQRLFESVVARKLPSLNLHAERSRLIREWSGFFSEYSVVVGPNLARPIWQTDSDLDARTGIAFIDEATRFLAPGNALGIPSLTLPTGLVNQRPQGIVIYADLWREDTCVNAAMAIESGLAVNRPIAPRWS
jgi:amidase